MNLPRLRSTCPPLPQAGCSGAINPQGNYITKQQIQNTQTQQIQNTKDSNTKIHTNTKLEEEQPAINCEANYITFHSPLIYGRKSQQREINVGILFKQITAFSKNAVTIIILILN